MIYNSAEEYSNRKYRLVHHSYVFCKHIGKSVCSNCGLVMANNEFTQWADRIGCMNDVHPSYKSKLKLTRPV